MLFQYYYRNEEALPCDHWIFGYIFQNIHQSCIWQPFSHCNAWVKDVCLIFPCESIKRVILSRECATSVYCAQNLGIWLILSYSYSRRKIFCQMKNFLSGVFPDKRSPRGAWLGMFCVLTYWNNLNSAALCGNITWTIFVACFIRWQHIGGYHFIDNCPSCVYIHTNINYHEQSILFCTC